MLRSKNVFLVLISLILLSSCNEVEENIFEKKTNRLDKKIPIKIDTLNIKIDSTQLTYYSVFYLDKMSSKYYGYNHKLHNIDVFSIDKGVAKNKIKLDKEGPNGVEEITAFELKENSIHVVSRNYLTVLDLEGRVKKKTLINSLENEFYKKNQIYITNPSEFTFVEGEGYYLKTVNYKDSQSKFPEKHYENGSILSLLSSSTGEIVNEFAIKYPSEYIDNYYGFNRLTYFLHSKDGESIYYSFSALPFIFKYDKSSEATTKYIYRSENLLVLKMETLDWGDSKKVDRQIKHYSVNSNFSSLYETDSFIFHIYTSGLKDGFKDFRNAGKFKKNSLLIFDKEINLVDVFNLEKGGVYNSGFTLKSKLYFPRIAKNEDTLSFLRCEI